MKFRSERGNTMLEVALFMPMIVMLLIGMTRIAGITYTYYTLRKAVYGVATYLSTEQGVNFCNNPGDPGITAAINFGTTGTTDGSGLPVVTGLTADMIAVTPETYDAASGATVTYDTSVCTNGDTIAPNFITVSIINGYTVQPAIPFFSTIQPLLLSPQVKVPYGGT